MKQVLSYGVVGLLAVALLAGTGYILLSPTEAQAERGPLGGQGQVQAQGRGETWQDGTGMENGAGSEVGMPDQGTYGHSEAVQGYGAFGGQYRKRGPFNGVQNVQAYPE